MSNHLDQNKLAINPYLDALRIIKKRLLWDLNARSWKSRKRISKWKNSHLNEKAIILCNGPSLNDVDFSLLDNTFCFGLNKINLLFDKTNFRPNTVVSVNKHVIQQNEEFFNNTEIPLFLDSKSSGVFKSLKDNMIFLHSSRGLSEFARDCSLSICQGYTVTYVALQLAYYMGFSKVGLVGCDHNFAVKGPSNKAVISKDDDKSHFDPNYFGKGVLWQLPDLVASEYYYNRAREFYEMDGRQVVNCTNGGNLEIFERKQLEKFLEE